MRIITRVFAASAAILASAGGLAGQQANSLNARLQIGATSPMTPGPFTVQTCPAATGPGTLITISSTAPSSGGVPVVVALGPALTAGGFTTPAGQKLDVSLAGMEIWSSLLPGFVNSWFNLNSAGILQFGYVVNSQTPDYAIQAAVVDPAVAPVLDGFTLTAAFQVQAVGYTTLTLGDDDAIQMPLGSWAFPFYDVAYAAVWICSNGRLTFGAGSYDFTESVAEFAAGPPSINIFWDDLNPSMGGTVTVCNDSGPQRFLIRFDAVPEFGTSNSNSGYAFLYGTGWIGLAYGSVSLADAIAGIGPGNGLDPAPTPVDLSGCAASTCTASGINAGIFEHFDGVATSFDLSLHAGVIFAPSTAPANWYYVY